jgi:hypothetical protein
MKTHTDSKGPRSPKGVALERRANHQVGLRCEHHVVDRSGSADPDPALEIEPFCVRPTDVKRQLSISFRAFGVCGASGVEPNRKIAGVAIDDLDLWLIRSGPWELRRT